MRSRLRQTVPLFIFDLANLAVPDALQAIGGILPSKAMHSAAMHHEDHHHHANDRER